MHYQVLNTVEKCTYEDAITDICKQLEAFCSSEAQADIKRLLTRHHNVFALEPLDVGRTSLVQHCIDTGDSSPVRQAPRRIPIHLQGEVNNMISEMLKADIIRPSESPWASSVVLVKKKDGSLRFCVDYRRLNSVTKKDSYPLPRIDDTIDALAGSQWFSTLELASGYWQVEVDPEDRAKTAFTIPSGLYEFNTMPFGLTNAPATFQRLMQLVLRDSIPQRSSESISTCQYHEARSIGISRVHRWCH